MIENLKQYIYELLSRNHIATDSQEFACHLLLILVALFGSWLVGYLFRRIIAPLLMRLVQKTHTLWDDYLLNDKFIHAVCRTMPGIIFYLVLPFCLPQKHELLNYIFLQGSKIYIAITFVSLIIVFLNNVETFTQEEETLKEKHLYGIIDFLKIATYCIGGIVIISFILGQNPLSMVAGIGAAATVLMLVFKDTILGLVAGIQLSTNKMIKPGDWITIKKSNIDGVVEEVSLTTVKIRNFDNTIYTVPPYSLISDTFQNWRSIEQGGGRRMKRALYIDQNSITATNSNLEMSLVEKKYLTEEQIAKIKVKTNLTLFRTYAQLYLQSQSFVIKNKTVLVRQLAPTPNGLPVEFYFFLAITDFVPYENLCAECMEHFLVALSDFGLQIYQNPYAAQQ